jgi:hypothetical protein
MCNVHPYSHTRREFVSTGFGAASLILGLTPESLDQLSAHLASVLSGK